MRFILTITDADGQRALQLNKGRLTLGCSDADLIRLNRNGRIYGEHAALSWEQRRSTWQVGHAAHPQAEVLVNGKTVPPDESVGLHHMDTIELPGVFIRFQRSPDAPMYQGRPVTEIALGTAPLILGRAEAGAAVTPGRLELDPEDSGISKVHAVIEKDGPNFYITDKSRIGTELNGKSFTREMLVFGDRFRIRDYLFEFTGRSVRRVDHTNFGSVAARSLCVDVVKNGKPLRILNDLSLDIRGGEFVGILGGSGQGKSTLLNALCGVNPASAGEVQISGVPLSSREQVSAVGVGYVPQDDIVHRQLTVTEAITYSARLRLKLPAAQINALVERVIERLALTEHREKRISQLSGGQRKRVSVATELLSKPSVLFLDEPSSGLDPATEADLMALLQSLRLTNLTVVCTTHVLQKAYLFDRLFFIHGGRLIFVGTADEARHHFLKTSTDTQAAADRSPLEKIYSLLADKTKSAAQWEQEFLDSPYSQRSAAAAVVPEPAAMIPPPPRSRVGYLKTLGILFARQWRILLADRLNLLFLLFQALSIGLLVGWVAENAGLRMFLCVVATLWFGCSNGAQEIVGELPIFRRERVCGLGLNVYLQSKVLFFSLLTSAQTVLLFFTVFCTAHVFHQVDFDQASFTSRYKQRVASMHPAPPETDEFDARDQTEPDKPGAESTPVATATPPPTPLELNPVLLNLTAGLARFFYLQDNILDSGSKEIDRDDGSPIRGPDGKTLRTPGLSIANVLGVTLGLKALALLAAALVGVSLGLMISALVRSNTQAVMWVPLILIPQILFGGFVVTVPEMSRSVFAFSHAVPSFSAQRIMDVSNIYGQATPFLTNRTKIPLFLTSDGSKETLTWQEEGKQRTQSYDKLSLFNTSWQNLVVFQDRVGQHKEARLDTGGDSFGTQYRDTVEARNDVRYTKSTVFQYLYPAELGLVTLAAWAALCYITILLGLRAKQTGQ